MPARKKPRRACRDYEREWNGLCVDKNLENDWLMRLNSLQCLRPISICEGHLNQKPGSAQTFPHVKLRLKEQFLPGVASHWEQLRSVLSNELHQLLHTADTSLELELKFRFRWGGSRFPYRENLTVRIHCRQARRTEKMDDLTYAWFEQTLDRIEVLDSLIGHQLCPTDQSA